MNINGRLVKRYPDSAPWEFNKMYWDKLSFRYKDDERVMFLCKYGKKYCKIAGGIAAVESSFNCCKDIHNRRRGALGPSKLRKLMFIKNNEIFLRKFKS